MTNLQSGLSSLLSEVLGRGVDPSPVLIADRRGTALWRMRDQLGDEYALKVTTPCSDPQGHVDSERLALVEAQLLQDLEQVGAVSNLYVGHGLLPDREGSWIALRWLDGDSAEAAFERLRHAPDPKLSAAYGAAMAGAVADLHETGWRHGDMQEVHFVFHGGRAHLLDFAMAQSPTAPVGSPVLYRGAYDYFMSPELAAERLSTPKTQHLTLTTQSEVWSLCAVLFACWTGVYPISEKDTLQSTQELRAELAEGKCRDLEAVRPWRYPGFEEIIKAGLVLEPTERPTARELEGMLQALV